MARFLVCDDSAFMRMMLKRVLADLGHEVIAEASNGEEAVAMFRVLKPDIATMDITMPKLDGIGALKAIRSEDQAAKIVMVTAIGQQAVINEATEAGALDFIVKPFEPAQVAQIVKKILS